MRVDYKMSYKAIATAIRKILGDGIITASTVQPWLPKIDAAKNDTTKLAKFLNCDKVGFSGLSSESVNAVIVYKHSKELEAKETATSLTKLFICNQDKDKFTLGIVQVSI